MSATSERPMSVGEVPDDLIDIAHKAFRFSDEQDTESALAVALAAVLPEHEKQVREQIAAKLEAYVDGRAALGWAENLQGAARQIAADIRRGES